MRDKNKIKAKTKIKTKTKIKVNDKFKIKANHSNNCILISNHPSAGSTESYFTQMSPSVILPQTSTS